MENDHTFFATPFFLEFEPVSPPTLTWGSPITCLRPYTQQKVHQRIPGLAAFALVLLAHTGRGGKLSLDFWVVGGRICDGEIHTQGKEQRHPHLGGPWELPAECSCMIDSRLKKKHPAEPSQSPEF